MKLALSLILLWSAMTVAQNPVQPNELETAKLQAAQANIQALSATLQMLQAQADSTQVRLQQAESVFDNQINAVTERLGKDSGKTIQYVRPNQQQPLGKFIAVEKPIQKPVEKPDKK